MSSKPGAGHNDSFGHSAGDEALRAIAHEVSKEGAVVGRLGGEEFAILLEGIPLSRAAEFAEGLRVRLGELEISIGQTKVSLTCSFGVSQWQILDTIDVLLRRADVALYKAKRSGRNRVVVGEYGVDVGDYDRSKSILRAGSRNFQRSVAALSQDWHPRPSAKIMAS